MFKVGEKVVLRRPVAFRDGGAAASVDIELPSGAYGVVTDMGDLLNPVVIVKMDQPFACLADFDNHVTFDQDVDDSCGGIGLAAEYLLSPYVVGRAMMKERIIARWKKSVYGGFSDDAMSLLADVAMATMLDEDSKTTQEQS